MLGTMDLERLVTLVEGLLAAGLLAAGLDFDAPPLWFFTCYNCFAWHVHCANKHDYTHARHENYVQFWEGNDSICSK